MSAYTSPDQPLHERFANPPAHTRILKNNHRLPADQQEAAALLKSYRECGFGGIVTNVSWEGGYLEDEAQFAQFVDGLKQARQEGMAVWLYDESWYPSGAGGGLVMRDRPELEVQGIFIATKDGSDDSLVVDVPPGRVIVTAAVPLDKDGKPVMEKAILLQADDLIPLGEGKLAWTPPEGTWKLVLITAGVIYENTQACESIKPARRYPSLLLPEVADRFVQSTHDVYAAHLGEDLNPWFVATFTDEPSLMSIFYPPMPYALLPWNDYLAAEFERRCGYALLPELLALAVDPGGKGMRVRCDYFRTVAELFSENYFGRLQKWCADHHTLSGGHLLLEEPLLAHVCLYGDYFRCARKLDAPGIDLLTSIPEEVPFHSARMVSSIAELSGAPVTMSEVSEFAQRMAKKPPVTVEQIRGSLNRQILGGITSFNSYYSYEEITPQQQAALSEYTGRCITLLEGGQRVTDIAVLYPVESAWAHFLAKPGWVSGHNSVGGFADSARQVQDCFRSVSDTLIQHRLDFAYIDTQALLDATIEKRTLKHGELEWKVLVLPGVDTLPLTAWEKIEQFWENGGVVIAVGGLPTNSTAAFPAPAVLRLAKTLFPIPGRTNTNPAGGLSIALQGAEAGDNLRELVRSIQTVLEADTFIEPEDCPIRITHRRTAAGEVYFVMNDSDQPWKGRIRFSAAGGIERWDPHTGEVQSLKSGGAIPTTLQPYGSVLYSFKRALTHRRTDI